jgi:hypothetical protein
VRLRISSALECVLALGVGMGWARWAWPRCPSFGGRLTQSPYLFLLMAFLTGFTVVIGITTCLEKVRRRSPPTWGIGRWILSITAMSTLITFIADLASIFLFCWSRSYNPTFSHIQMAVQDNVPFGLFDQPGAGPAMIAVWLTSLFNGHPRNPAPDAREWAGRGLLAFFALLTIAERANIVMGWAGLP